MVPSGTVVLFLVVSTEAIQLGLIDGSSSTLTLCKKAIVDAKKNGHCTSASIAVLNVASCDPARPAVGTTNAVSLFYKQNVDAYIAPVCSDEMEEISRLSYFFKRPVLTRTLANDELIKIAAFPNVMQFATISTAGVAVALARIAYQLDSQDIVLVSSNRASLDNPPMALGIAAYYKLNPLLNNSILLQFSDSGLTKDQGTTIRKLQIKLVAVMGDFANPLSSMKQMELSDLVRAGHVVVLVCKLTFALCVTDADSFTSVGAIALAPDDVNSANQTSFLQGILGSDYQAGLLDQYVTSYGACYGYCFGSLKNTNNGDSYTTAFAGSSYTNALGTTSFDAGNSRMQSYSVTRLSGGSPVNLLSLVPFSSPCSFSTCFNFTVTQLNTSYWVDHAKEKVDYSAVNPTNDALLIGILSAVLLVAAISTVVWWYYGRRRASIFRMTWRISKEQVKIIEMSKKNTTRERPGKLKREVAGMKKEKSEYALIGHTKADFLRMKQLKRIRFSQEDLIYIVKMKRLSHENLASFIGINYNESGQFMILSALVERSNLDDFIQDSEFNMADTAFKSAFIRDVVRGLGFLHKMVGGYHGMLNTFTCMVDNNWVLKLTRFGFSNMLNSLQHEGHLLTEEKIEFAEYAFTAPEMLVIEEYPEIYPRGSQSADIYQLGLVIYSIFFQRRPFPDGATPKQKVLQKIVEDGLQPSFDGLVSSTNTQLIALLHKCWERTAVLRPDQAAVQVEVTKIFESQRGNLVDQMLRMNEKYANNLEVIVNQREAMIKDAQEQANRLLSEMLPPAIAEALKRKEHVIPRSYEAVTVLFCQLVDFPELSQTSKAGETIQFLNDVFSRFDEIIKKHDAYKVETTGETYMVASGVPNENEGRHLFEIADIALSLRDQSYRYRVAFKTEFKVRVRIGFHCGPIAAGVIGLKSPRYCLFGDTVNFASRMQSNCPPNQIQTSEHTANILMQNPDYTLVKRGIVKVKGKGDVNCYWLNEHIHGEHGIDVQEIMIGKSARPGTRSLRMMATNLLRNTRGGRQGGRTSAVRVDRVGGRLEGMEEESEEGGGAPPPPPESRTLSPDRLVPEEVQTTRRRWEGRGEPTDPYRSLREDRPLRDGGETPMEVEGRGHRGVLLIEEPEKENHARTSRANGSLKKTRAVRGRRRTESDETKKSL